MIQNLVTQEQVKADLSGLKFVVLTQAQYDVLETKDENTLYIING